MKDSEIPSHDTKLPLQRTFPFIPIPPFSSLANISLFSRSVVVSVLFIHFFLFCFYLKRSWMSEILVFVFSLTYST